MIRTNEDRSRFKISASHRNQPFVGTFRRDRDTYTWSWEGRIDFVDGQQFEFASRRSFATAAEAEDYMRRFVCARIDSQLTA